MGNMGVAREKGGGKDWRETKEDQEAAICMVNTGVAQEKEKEGSH
jgi:hypothetical protein